MVKARWVSWALAALVPSLSVSVGAGAFWALRGRGDPLATMSEVRDLGQKRVRFFEEIALRLGGQTEATAVLLGLVREFEQKSGSLTRSEWFAAQEKLTAAAAVVARELYQRDLPRYRELERLDREWVQVLGKHPQRD